MDKEHKICLIIHIFFLYLYVTYPEFCHGQENY